MEDCLVITVDISKGDMSTLLVTRRVDDLSFTIVNQIFGDDAVEIYQRLVGDIKR